jgi:hypothetical protein
MYEHMYVCCAAQNREGWHFCCAIAINQFFFWGGGVRSAYHKIQQKRSQQVEKFATMSIEFQRLNFFFKFTGDQSSVEIMITSLAIIEFSLKMASSA